ncbi:peptidylprolyl isomerase [Pseudomaricurvus alkylphenolicus]|jgi:FKBP-type peptidyl-prolyl cis-trans isomerase SlyD|uniref:FKBP-type peptidyl-prolyl cis-trans isomerase n=1 Tax=Pseudomaricurvus alkylphenolicus TaxID=1306991 RepID=UPI00141F8243|nr:peptidylprolyl isomerase [Pseudomaricurvus alkylphenolicus]NIB43987.1 peptidylprolyl isomerase [Pseudomaricurvus alkylphenolicus]
MQISKDKVVSFHYRLKEEGGDIFEDSHDGNPVLYLHGHGGMLRGLESAMEERSAGDSFDVTVDPDNGYGQRKELPPQRVPKKHLVTKGKINVGQVVHINTEKGPQEAVVVKVGLKNVDVDPNHPLAGKTLVFAVEIVDVREATEEELAHGHAHGVGGHQH